MGRSPAPCRGLARHSGGRLGGGGGGGGDHASVCRVSDRGENASSISCAPPRKDEGYTGVQHASIASIAGSFRRSRRIDQGMTPSCEVTTAACFGSAAEARASPGFSLLSWGTQSSPWSAATAAAAPRPATVTAPAIYAPRCCPAPPAAPRDSCIPSSNVAPARNRFMITVSSLRSHRGQKNKVNTCG